MAKNNELIDDCISLLKDRNIPIDEKKFRNTTFVEINGYECTFANKWGVNVNKDWFKEPLDMSQPSIKRHNPPDERKTDFQLFPRGDKLFALHYSELREYALQLEEDREDWHKKNRWGMEINDGESLFRWRGEGNTKTFPLRKIKTKEDFSLQSDPATLTASDINDPPEANRIECSIYRILRDTKLTREIKELYDFKCQICGKTIEFDNGGKYAEAHHIKPLGTPHNGPDIKENIICVCPNHHAQFDFGGIKLDHSNIETNHALSEKYIQYHNAKIYKRI